MPWGSFPAEAKAQHAAMTDLGSSSSMLQTTARRCNWSLTRQLPNPVTTCTTIRCCAASRASTTPHSVGSEMSRPASSSSHIQRRMQTQRQRNTKPELALRRELDRRGMRFRLQRQLLPDMRRISDIVFGPAASSLR